MDNDMQKNLQDLVSGVSKEIEANLNVSFGSSLPAVRTVNPTTDEYAMHKRAWGFAHEGSDKVIDELVRAENKHGFAWTPMNPSMNPNVAFVILAEEVGEVARALTYDQKDDVALGEELIQVAAMALAMWVGLQLRSGQ